MKHRALTHPKHRPLVFWLFIANIALGVIWGPVLIVLTLAGPLRHLGTEVLWVVIISYYANMMGNIASASGLYSSLVAHRAVESIGKTTSHDGGTW